MAKKKHPVRNFFIGLILVFGIALTTVGVLVTDFTNNTPEYTSEVKGVTTGDYMGGLADESFKDCGIFDDYEFLLDEHKINNLLATIVESLNIPLLNFKSIYLNIDTEDNIYAEAPFWAAFYRCCAKANGKLVYDDESLTLRLTEVKVNMLNSKAGIVDWVLSDTMVADIEKSINDSGVYLTMWRDGKDLCAKMTIIDICKTIIACSKNAAGFLSAALVAGALTTKSVDLVVNEKGLTGIIVHRKLL